MLNYKRTFLLLSLSTASFLSSSAELLPQQPGTIAIQGDTCIQNAVGCSSDGRLAMCDTATSKWLFSSCPGDTKCRIISSNFALCDTVGAAAGIPQAAPAAAASTPVVAPIPPPAAAAQTPAVPTQSAAAPSAPLPASNPPAAPAAPVASPEANLGSPSIAPTAAPAASTPPVAAAPVASPIPTSAAAPVASPMPAAPAQTPPAPGSAPVTANQVPPAAPAAATPPVANSLPASSKPLSAAAPTASGIASSAPLAATTKPSTTTNPVAAPPPQSAAPATSQKAAANSLTAKTAASSSPSSASAKIAEGATTASSSSAASATGAASAGGASAAPGGVMCSKDEFVEAVKSAGAIQNNGQPNPAPSDAQWEAFSSQATTAGGITSKRELAMALTHFIWESGGLVHKAEVACAQSGCPGQYEKPGTDVPGKRYYGRGYIQLTWSYNYKQASEDLYKDDRLLKDPDQVAKDEKVAWATSLWFWKKNVHTAPGVTDGKFGATTKAINGGLECGNGPNVAKARKRWEMFQKVKTALKVSEAATEDGCY